MHARILRSARRHLDLSYPAVMGILNVTPDSFSDGGQHNEREVALQRGLDMVAEGARIIDIGGESTRPGAAHVSVAEELERVIPVVEALRSRSDVFISVDTSTPEVMAEASRAGADLVNDIRALTGPGALQTVVDTDMAVCVMHMQGQPATMQDNPAYEDVVAEVGQFLAERVRACQHAGLPADHIVVDPGFGFGKNLEHNLALLRAIGQFHIEDCPVLMGLSRKHMFARLFASRQMESRINGSLGAAFWGALSGADIIRCHDVRPTVEMVQLAATLQISP